jgi:hypothetical protein
MYHSAQAYALPALPGWFPASRVISAGILPAGLLLRPRGA